MAYGSESPEAPLLLWRSLRAKFFFDLRPSLPQEQKEEFFNFHWNIECSRVNKAGLGSKVNLAEKVAGAIQRILLPEIQLIKGELKAINAKLDASDAKLSSMDFKISAMDSKIDAFRNEFRSEMKRLDEKIDGLTS